MRLLTGAIGVLACLAAAGAEEPAATRRSREEAERTRRLVEEGVLPRRALAEAERVLAEAADEAVLERSLFGNLTLEELSAEQSEAMVSAAGRRVERQEAECARVRDLVLQGGVAAGQLASLEEELARRRLTLELARNRARLFQDLLAIVRIEEELERAIELSPERAAAIAERFDGGGVFRPAQFSLIRAEFRRAFARDLPVSADGATALHRVLGFDHRGRVDVAVEPESPEGVWLRRLLERMQIPYFAFRRAAAGRSTGAHIHIGPPSGRLASAD